MTAVLNRCDLRDGAEPGAQASRRQAEFPLEQACHVTLIGKPGHGRSIGQAEPAGDMAQCLLQLALPPEPSGRHAEMTDEGTVGMFPADLGLGIGKGNIIQTGQIGQPGRQWIEGDILGPVDGLPYFGGTGTAVHGREPGNGRPTQGTPVGGGGKPAHILRPVGAQTDIPERAGTCDTVGMKMQARVQDKGTGREVEPAFDSGLNIVAGPDKRRICGEMPMGGQITGSQTVTCGIL